MGDNDSQLERELSEHQEALSILAREADRRIGDVARRHEVLNNRATLLISSAAIASGVQVGGVAGGWQLAALAATLLAALAGIASLFGRRGREVNLDALQRTLYGRGPRELELEVLNVKRATLNDDESSVSRRYRAIRAGFVLLAVAVLLTGVQAVATVSHNAEEPSSTTSTDHD
jgi:hypothetical protein